MDMAKLKADESVARKEAFDRFMASRTTRFMLSMIPQCEPKETVDTLLQAAFDAGFTAGGGAFASQMATALLSRDKQDGGK